MNCLTVQDLLPSLALGALSPKEREDVESHALSCPVCRPLLLEYQSVSAQLAAAVPQEAPPQRLKSAVMGRVARSRTAAGRERRFALPRLWPGLAFAAAAAAFIALVGGNLYLLQGTRDLRSETDRLRDQVAALQAGASQTMAALTTVQAQQDQMNSAFRSVRTLSYWGLAPNTSVTLLKGQGQPDSYGMVMTPPTPTTVLLVAKLQPPPPGRAYQAWLVHGGQRADGGVFIPGPDGWVSVQIDPERAGVAMSEVEAIGVTEEPETGSPGPTSPPVIFGSTRQPIEDWSDVLR